MGCLNGNGLVYTILKVECGILLIFLFEIIKIVRLLVIFNAIIKKEKNFDEFSLHTNFENDLFVGFSEFHSKTITTTTNKNIEPKDDILNGKTDQKPIYENLYIEKLLKSINNSRKKINNNF